VGGKRESKMKEEEGKREKERGRTEIGIFQERSGEVGKLSDRLFSFSPTYQRYGSRMYGKNGLEAVEFAILIHASLSELAKIDC
jgi:hypothetical protein